MADFVWCNELNGGTPEALDSIDVSGASGVKTLFACVFANQKSYFYHYDPDSLLAESVPDVIRPDIGAGAWRLLGFRANRLKFEDFGIKVQNTPPNNNDPDWVTYADWLAGNGGFCFWLDITDENQAIFIRVTGDGGAKIGGDISVIGSWYAPNHINFSADGGALAGGDLSINEFHGLVFQDFTADGGAVIGGGASSIIMRLIFAIVADGGALIGGDLSSITEHSGPSVTTYFRALFTNDTGSDILLTNYTPDVGSPATLFGAEVFRITPTNDHVTLDAGSPAWPGFIYAAGTADGMYEWEWTLDASVGSGGQCTPYFDLNKTANTDLWRIMIGHNAGPSGFAVIQRLKNGETTQVYNYSSNLPAVPVGANIRAKAYVKDNAISLWVSVNSGAWTYVFTHGEGNRHTKTGTTMQTFVNHNRDGGGVTWDNIIVTDQTPADLGLPSLSPSEIAAIDTIGCEHLGGATSWATVRGAASGTTLKHGDGSSWSDNSVLAYAEEYNGYNIGRAIIEFPIPPNLTDATAATVSVYVDSGGRWGSPIMRPYRFELVNNAWDATLYQATKMDTDAGTQATVTATGWKAFTIPASWINDARANGILRIALREVNYDIGNSAPSLATTYGIGFHGVGVSTKPKLTLTY